MELDRTARRVLGSLIEKRLSTPDLYPLSLNALVAACNQKSNRDPEMDLEPFEVEGCLLALRQAGLVVVHERDGGRVTRYGERLAAELSLAPQQEAILAELLLRGPQTAPELHRRCNRMTDFQSADQVEDLLDDMAARHVVKLLPREPGQRHMRWTHLLAPAAEAPEPPVPATAPGAGAAPVAAEAAPRSRTEEDIEELRAEVAALRTRVEELHAVLEKLRERL